MFNKPPGESMETATHHSAEVRASACATAFVPLERETRAAVETACAAYHLNRKQQTLRGWACHEDGPIRPLRINGRLAWPVAEIKKLLGVQK